MSNNIYIVFDEDGLVYGVFEEFVDAEERKAELQDLDNESMDDTRYLIEEFPLNTDIDPSGE